MREDQLTLEQVAADAKRPLQQMTFYVGELAPELQSKLLACATDQLLGPIRWEEYHALSWVIHKVLPSEADPQIRQKAEDTILELLVKREISDRVRWHIASSNPQTEICNLQFATAI